jgi:hypothetical protein
MSTNLVINDENQNPPMWCCMPRHRGMIFSVSVLLLVSLGFLTFTVSVEGSIGKGRGDDAWNEQALLEASVIGYSVDIAVDLLAMVSLCAKRFRPLLAPWILLNSIYFCLFCVTLICPLALLWFFMVRTMLDIYKDNFRDHNRMRGSIGTMVSAPPPRPPTLMELTNVAQTVQFPALPTYEESQQQAAGTKESFATV